MALADRLMYGLSGLTRRLRQSCRCPVCSSQRGHAIDRKAFHVLRRCDACGIAYRFPYETPGELAAFYQARYLVHGLTTTPPPERELDEFMAGGFEKTDKDFGYTLSSLRALGLPSHARIVDFGASWGYHTWQMVRAGFDATGYEISRSRAAFAQKLDVVVHTALSEVPRNVDAVYSSHVLEHVSNPREVLEQQLSLVREGGMVIAHTPNGSEGRRKADPRGFHLNWGRVHPLLLSDDFVVRNFARFPYYVSSDDRPERVGAWCQSTQFVGDTDGGGLFFVIVKADV